MKKLLTVLAIFALVFAACEEEKADNNNENDDGTKTTLRIRNQSSKTISAVFWNNVSFVTKENADVMGTWTGVVSSDFLSGTLRLVIGDKTWTMSIDDNHDGGTWTRNGNNFNFQSYTQTYGIEGTAILFNGKLSINIRDSGYSLGTYELTSDNLDNSINLGASVTKTVEDGSGYIFFEFDSFSYRTTTLIVVEKEENAEFTFTDNTVVVEVSNPNNTGVLKDLISKLRAPVKPLLSVGDGSIIVSWTAISGAVSYRVYCGTNTAPPETPAKTTTETSTTITGLTNDVTYYVWVQAVNSGTASGLSEMAQAKPTTNFTANNRNTFISVVQNINNAPDGTYTITVTGSFEADMFGNYFKDNSNKTIIIKGDSVARTINNIGNASGAPLFSVPDGTTLELGNNITLNGNYRGTVVSVSTGGTFIMNNGSSVTGAVGNGVSSIGTFNMLGGTISNNNVVGEGNDGGRGVNINGGTFTMSGGAISDNSAFYGGGGVQVSNGSFIMTGGTISGNYVHERGNGAGGGVLVRGGSFTKTGGTIDDTNDAAHGKVAYVNNGSKTRNTTAGPGDNLNSAMSGTSGGWE